MKTGLLMPISKIATKHIRGVQVASIPDYVQKMYRDGKTGEVSVEALEHKDTQLGFVTSVIESKHIDDERWFYCRYFMRNFLVGNNELRTKANSESTPERNLFLIEGTNYAKSTNYIVHMIEEYC